MQRIYYIITFCAMPGNVIFAGVLQTVVYMIFYDTMTKQQIIVNAGN